MALQIDALTGQVKGYPVAAEGFVRVEGQLISAQDLQVKVGGNQLNLNGDAGEGSGLDWRVDAQELAIFHKDFPGHLQGQGNVSGLLDGSRLTLRIAALEGQVKGYPLKASGGIRVEDKQLSAQNLKVNIGDNLLSLNGQADSDAGINWQLAAEELVTLHPEFPGFLKGQGHAKGLLDGSRLALQIDELAGEVRGYPVKAAGGVSVEGEQLAAQNLQMTVGDNLISFNGQAYEDSGIDWRFAAPELAAFYPALAGRLNGQGNVQGLLDGSRLALRIDALDGRVQGYPLKAAGSLRVEGEQLSAQHLNINVGDNLLSLNGQADDGKGVNWLLDAPALVTLHSSLAGQLKGQGHVAGLLDGSRLALNIAELGGEVNSYPVQVQGAVRVQRKRLSADKLRVNVGENVISLNGDAAEDSGLDWLIDAPALVAFHPQLSGQLAGKGKAQGRLDGSRLVVSIDELAGKVNDYPVAASGALRVVSKRLFADELTVSVGKNTVSLNGQADTDEGIEWRLDAPQLVAFHPELSGQLAGKGRASGRLDGSQLALEIDELKGKVRDYPVKAGGTVRWQKGQLSADQLKLSVGKNVISLNGQVAADEGIDWQIDAPELAALYPELKGDLTGSGSAQGLFGGSPLRVTIAELVGEIQGYPLQADGVVRFEDQQLFADDLTLTVAGNALILNGQVDEDKGINWRLNAAKLSALHPTLSGELKGNGVIKALLDGSRLTLEIDKLQGRVRDYPLRASGSIKVKDQLLSAQNFTLRMGENKISLNGVADEVSGIDWRLDAPALVALHPELSGFVKGRGNARGLLDGSRLAFRVDELTGRVKDYPLQAGGEVRIRKGVVSARDFRLSMGKNKLRIDGVADEATGVDWELDAPDLAALHPAAAGFLAGNGKVKGKLDGSRAAVRINKLEGRIKGFPVRVVGGVGLRDGLVSANDLRVALGVNNLRLDGVANEKKGINWVLDAPQLAQIEPSLQGHLQGNGNIKACWTAPA